MSGKIGKTVAVIGGGRWARALAATLVKNRLRSPHRVAQVLHYRPPRETAAAASGDEPSTRDVIPATVAVAGIGAPAGSDVMPSSASSKTPDLGIIPVELSDLGEADLLLLAAPAMAVRGLLRIASGVLHGGQTLVHAIGSLSPALPDEGHGALLISYVVRQETPIRRIGVLAGPALAPDLEEFNPSALICGSQYADVGEAIIQTLAGPSLRIYTTQDLIGVEVARAGAAVIALASGVASALDLGAPARAILITRGAAEMARLGVALGGNKDTFFGLAGVGELVVATERRGSADFELGRLLGLGRTLPDALREVGRVCDGPGMVRVAHALAHRFHLRMPLVTALHSWLAGEQDTRTALADLFKSDNHAE
jgi:glycerol-3-phosphate dehydrogenase (NAD(P)+)